jgi:hypothetical protein
MNDQPVTAEEQDDAAFRARLAPLASEVLPAPPNTDRQAPRRRRPILVSAAIATVVVVLGITGLLSKWPRSVPITVAPPAPDPMIALLMQRGDAALADGDIIGARLLFERAAGLGSAAAATWAGKTYDIEFLSQAGARGIRADQTAALVWFRKAASLGDREAQERVARIEARGRP